MKSRNSWPFILLSTVGTSSFLLVQFLLITFIRGGIIVTPAVGWRILAPGLIAGLIAPLFYWTVSHMDRLLPDGSRKLRSVKR
jgi:hypothetical protein